MAQSGGEDPGAIRAIVASYDSLLIRCYAQLRFVILRQWFLDEIGQYLPQNARILDVGCGFGLFSLYFARSQPGRTILGCDIDEGRIASARASAARLGLGNVQYEVASAPDFEPPGDFDAIYMLDLVHHLPRATVPAFLASLRRRLRPGGVLVVKDVEDRPAWRRWFTLLLDRAMVGGEPIHYWPASELATLLTALDLDVVRHRMRDVLPYPHVLYVGRAPR